MLALTTYQADYGAHTPDLCAIPYYSHVTRYQHNPSLWPQLRGILANKLMKSNLSELKSHLEGCKNQEHKVLEIIFVSMSSSPIYQMCDLSKLLNLCKSRLFHLQNKRIPSPI